MSHPALCWTKVFAEDVIVPAVVLDALLPTLASALTADAAVRADPNPGRVSHRRWLLLLTSYSLLGGGIPKERVCHVGDSLHHDIAGANASGVDCLWVAATGIHADELGLAADATALPSDAYDRVVGAWGGKPPTHVTMRFRWEG